MLTRTIFTTSRVRSLQLAECLSSLFTLELISTSPQYYLISPWITDFAIINNGFGQFRALLPERIDSRVRLSSLLQGLHDRGAEVFVLTRPDSQEFLSRLPRSERLHVKLAPQLHEKSFVCQNFMFTGSMNFTYTGANQSDEAVTVSTEREQVAKALLEAERRWDSA